MGLEFLASSTLNRGSEVNLNAVQSTPVLPRNRATSVREFARLDPAGHDYVAEFTATALRHVSPRGAKHLASAGGVCEKRATAWWREGKGSPVFDFFALIYCLTSNPKLRVGALIAHARSLMYGAQMPQDTDTLVRRFMELKGEEDQAEGQENAAGSRVPWTGDLASYERALMEEAGIQEELAAVCRELRRRKVDPYRWGK